MSRVTNDRDAAFELRPKLFRKIICQSFDWLRRKFSIPLPEDAVYVTVAVKDVPTSGRVRIKADAGTDR